LNAALGEVKSSLRCHPSHVSIAPIYNDRMMFPIRGMEE
jgi:hypothetical protein